MTRRYETLAMLDVTLSDEKTDQIVGKIEEMIKTSEGGEILTLDRWGKKRLAYEINKKQFGYYVLFEYTAPSDVPREIERYCRFESGVIRQLTLVIPDRVLKLKDKEQKLKVEMEERRREAAENRDEDFVEDMLEAKHAGKDEGEDSDGKKADDAKADDKSDEKKAEDKSDEKKADDEQPKAEADKESE